jgi:CRISPR-associated protein Cas2
MFVVLSYDIGTKRVKRALKTCRKYLRHVHRSVFEGGITEGELNRLKRELEGIVDARYDSVCIYRIESVGLVYKEEIGVVEVVGEII